MLDVNKNIGTIGVSFTPRFYKQALNSAINGSYRQLIAMMEQAETDSWVQGCLDGRLDGFKRKWTLNEATDLKQDLVIKDFVLEIFNSINMRDLFENIFEARTKKYVVIDFDIEIIEGKWIVTNFQKYNQKYFRYDKDGKLKIDHGNGKLLDIPEDTTITAQTNKIPLLLPVLRDFILKEFGVESWAQFMETFGQPFVMGEYPPNASMELKRELRTAVDSIARSARGIKPKGYDINIIESKKGTSDFVDFKHECDAGIAITLLGHANAVSDTAGMKIGENLAPFKVRLEKAINDIYFIESYIQKLVKIIVDKNFIVKNYPLFEIDKSGPVNVRDFLAVLSQFSDQGGKVDPNDYRKLGISIADEQDYLQRFISPD